MSKPEGKPDKLELAGVTVQQLETWRAQARLWLDDPDRMYHEVGEHVMVTEQLMYDIVLERGYGDPGLLKVAAGFVKEVGGGMAAAVVKAKLANQKNALAESTEIE